MPNLTAKIKGTKEFKSALSGIQSLMEEVTFIANEDGINYMGLDPSGISFIDVNFPKDVFEEYKVDGETKLNIRSNEFLDVIKRAKVNDIITFSIIEHSGTLSIEWGAKKFGVRMLNLLEDARGGKRPTIEFEMKAIMNSSDFADIVKDVATVSEGTFVLTSTPKQLTFSGKGDSGNAVIVEKMEVEQKSEDELTSMFAMEQLLSMVKTMASNFDKVQLESGKDLPLKITWASPEMGEFKFILASKI